MGYIEEPEMSICRPLRLGIRKEVARTRLARLGAGKVSPVPGSLSFN